MRWLARRATQRVALGLIGGGAVAISALFLSSLSERDLPVGSTETETTSRRESLRAPEEKDEALASSAAVASANAAQQHAEQHRQSDRPDETRDGPGMRRDEAIVIGKRAGRSATTRDATSSSASSAPTRRGGPATIPIASTAPPPASQPDDPAKGTGLTGVYVAFKSTLKQVPALDGLPGALVRLDPTIDFPATNDWNLNLPALETFAASWHGFFRAPVSGHYAFVVGSHDGSVLTIDNTPLVAKNALQPYTETRGEVDLVAGFHVLELSFFIDLVEEKGTEPVCRLLCATPGQGLVVVPTELLYPSDAPGAAKVPQIQSATPQGARRGQTVTLVGANFGSTTDANAVSFGDANVPAAVTAASPTQLSIVVPDGVDAGPIKLVVSGQSAPAFPYTVGGNFGLDARFYRETDQVDVTTYLDPKAARAPDDERIVGPIALSGPGSFGLSFPATRFRAELVGQFYANAQGDHRFGLECDAGARLLIDGQLAVDATAAPAHSEGKATLAQGWHVVQLDYFTNQAGAKLNLLHADPGGSLGICPRCLLAPPPEIDAQAPPTIISIDHPTPTHVGDTITIKGSGLALGDGRMPKVLLRGTPLVVHAAQPDALTVEIFADALGGPLTVQVGPLVSNAVNLDVEKSPGLLTRSVTIKRLPANVAAPTIDGKGDDLAWQQVDPLGAFVPCFQPGVGQYTTPLTQAWVTYDAKSLYLLVKCYEPQVSQMTLVGKRHEDPIYTGDAVDLFFSTGTSAIPHAHLILNPNNVTWSAMIAHPYDFSGSTSYDGDKLWNPPVATGASIYDEGWSIEWGIPWTSLGIPCPQSGETHQVNIGRSRPAGPDYTCWSQTMQNFLEPDHFGTWTFK